MGKCKKVTIKIAKHIAQAVSPPGIRFIATIVGILEQTDWSNETKRETAVDLAKAEARAAGREAQEAAIRAAIEATVVGLKKTAENIDELGEDPDLEDAETV